MRAISNKVGVVAGLLVLCAAAGAISEWPHAGTPSGASMATPKAGVVAQASGGAPGSVAAAGPLGSTLAVDFTPAVIRTATLDLRVGRSSLQRELTQARAIAAAAGGLVASSSVETLSGRTATLVMRIPAARFETTLTRLEGLGQVRRASEQGRDVSRQLVDLNAQIVNLSSQRRVLRSLMSKARTIAASIAVETRLSEVQGQIEQLAGEQRYLESRAALGTISMQFSTAAPVSTQPQHSSTLWKALARSADAAQSVLVAVIVGAGFVIPIALLIGLAAIAARRLRQVQSGA